VGFTGEAGTRTLWSDSGVAPGGSLLAARQWREQSQFKCSEWLAVWELWYLNYT